VDGFNGALIESYIANFDQRARADEFEKKIAELTAEVERLAKLVHIHFPEAVIPPQEPQP
jgi:hypothetical protein